MHACVNVWIYGCVDVWMFGCGVKRQDRYTTSQTALLSNYKDESLVSMSTL